MSSNITLMNSTEDKNLDQEMAQNKVPSLDKSGSASKNITEQTEKLDSKKISVQLSSSDDKKISELDPKDMRIKILKSAHDDKSCSSMSVSLYICHIPRKKQKIKYQKLQSQVMK